MPLTAPRAVSPPNGAPAPQPLQGPTTPPETTGPGRWAVTSRLMYLLLSADYSIRSSPILPRPRLYPNEESGAPEVRASARSQNRGIFYRLGAYYNNNSSIID